MVLKVLWFLLQFVKDVSCLNDQDSKMEKAPGLSILELEICLGFEQYFDSSVRLLFFFGVAFLI